jgi:hypothetical protein
MIFIILLLTFIAGLIAYFVDGRFVVAVSVAGIVGILATVGTVLVDVFL